MGEQEVGALLREAVAVVLTLGGPPLLAGLAVGLAVSLVQAVTQVHRQAAAWVPKIIAVVAALLLFGPYLLGTLPDSTRPVFDRLIEIGAQ